MREDVWKTADQLISEQFPGCDAALLAGSVIRGEDTSTSDLDIIIFDERIESSYRDSFYFKGWPVEVFAHNWTSYLDYVTKDIEVAIPSLPRMIAEGRILRGHKNLFNIKKEAEHLLERGPSLWNTETLETKRYFISDTLDDFIGSRDRAESIWIAQDLSIKLHEFVLRTNGHWIGKSKWVIRALRNYDERWAERFIEAFEAFYKQGEKQWVINLVDESLQPFGGRLFEGYSRGKQETNDST
ncbi:nucleotidyltransferase domain-containing protein [Halobacillus litoralis]|uniref:nucleotidyltransferase domain-containing protein n=1 Tax=Halobacillus litoralis TaxID=45668 RepID=UPI001CD5068D|nr:nucleotidyltransferase domain-containing protein [Halobacillus litoralis]MCA0969026.1 nucleotidyltransferase domain-containing protein [Halobacillus litoralis]